MSFRYHIARHITGRLLYKGVDIINVILLGKIFDDWTLGQYNQYIMECSLLVLMLNFGLGSSVQYFVGKGLLSPKRVSRISLYIMLVASVILIAISTPLSSTAGFNFTTSHFLAWIVAYAIFGVWQEINYSLCLSIKKINSVNYGILLGPLIILVLYLAKWGGYISLDFRTIVILAAANQLLIGVISSMTIARARIPSIVKQAVSVPEVFSFGFLIYVTNIVQFLVYRFDYWMVEAHDLRHFPYFTLAAQMVSFLWFVPQRVSDISYIYTTEDNANIKQIVAISAGLMFYVQLALGFLFCVAFLVVFYLIGMSSFYLSIQYFLVLLLPACLFGMATIFSAYQAGSRRLMLNFWGSLLACLVAIALSSILIPLYGVRGALLESALTYTFVFFYHYYYFKKYCAFSIKMLISEPIKELRRILNEKDFSFSKFISDQ